MYRLVYESKAQKQLKKLDGATRRKIISWMTKNVDNTSNPYQHAKLVVLAVDIAHRREVYK